MKNFPITWTLKQMSQILLILVFATGCGNKSYNKAEKAINSHLNKETACLNLPIQVPLDTSKVSDDGALGLLLKAGIIIESEIGTDKDSKNKRTGYDFTEKGKDFIVKPLNGNTLFGSFIGTYPCVRTGKYIVDSVKAIDYGQSVDGKPIANVRVTVRFIPEDWVAKTKSENVWVKFWANVKKQEESQWLYKLLKSGDELFFLSKERIE